MTLNSKKPVIATARFVYWFIMLVDCMSELYMINIHDKKLHKKFDFDRKLIYIYIIY